MHTQLKLYAAARKKAVASLQIYREYIPDENDEGFKGHFMDALALYISVQPSSQGEMPPALPPKSPYQDLSHQMSMVDAKLPATSGISVLKQLQDVHPATKNKSPQIIKEIKVSSTNIMILEARNSPEHQIIEDPNVAGAVAGLTAPRQSGETVQAYD